MNGILNDEQTLSRKEQRQMYPSHITVDMTYTAILDAYRGLNDRACEKLNARLKELLTRPDGSKLSIVEALAVARHGID